MSRILFSLIALFVSVGLSQAQVTTSPQCFQDDQMVTIRYNASQGTSELQGASKVYMHSGVITDSPSGTTWKYVIGDWGVDNGVGQMTKVAGQTDIWEISITPRSYYSVPTSEVIYRLGMVFRNADGSKEGKSNANGDIFVDLATSAIDLMVSSPMASPTFADAGGTVQFTASTCGPADYTLFINDVVEHTTTNSTLFEYDYLVAGAPGSVVNSRLEVTDGVTVNKQEFDIHVRTPVVETPRPEGIIDGINYDVDPTKATVSLWAPFKTNVYLVGDFNDWMINPAYLMKKDGEHFWFELNDLTPGVEYGFQYLVEESIWIADPYADKILDPDDVYIPTTTYPNLKAYPSGGLHPAYVDNRVSILQTSQVSYEWQTTDFKKPAKEDLIVYEMLVRDYLGDDHMNYQTLIDTLSYIKKLGVNVIELMPIMEFNGNDSWGYNPTFMFAVDKAYGTRDDLKMFIDSAHHLGMAVILDMVMNQNDVPSPYAKMYFDDKPTNENPWFNRDATHPFNVFFDINHESTYTKSWLDTINHYWLTEFKFDGFRFDLSKGFTQRNNPNDVSAWSSYDDSRISILKRMATEIWRHTPDAYVILEHFAANSEEKILSDFGMMLWGNSHGEYKEANLGYAENKTIASAYYKERGWEKNYLVSYMESHDEQRQMYEMAEFGNSGDGYDITNNGTALNRLKLSATFFFLVPGPKMFWQFGEFGYDVDIDFNGRTGKKPTKWEYLENPNKSKVAKVYSELISLRNRYPVFTTGDFSWEPDGALKSIHIDNGDTSITVLGNFGVAQAAMNPEFQHTGTWYDFFSGGEMEVTNVSEPFQLAPGQFIILTDKKLHTPETDLILAIEEEYLRQEVMIYPNPAVNQITVTVPEAVRNFRLKITDLAGRNVYSQSDNLAYKPLGHTIETRSIKSGLYLVIIETQNLKISKLLYKE